MADMAVVETAYRTAVQLGATPKVLLALFEAGLVESGFRNLDHGDRDSLGYLQQRPSQGWPSPRDVPTATRSFVTRAIANERARPGLTAGQLAQSVQRSAFPDRYDKREAEARGLLERVRGGPAGIPPGGVPDYRVSPPSGSLVDAVAAAAAALGEMAAGAAHIGALARQATKLALPSTMVRIGAGIGGIILVFAGAMLLAREVRNGG